MLNSTRLAILFLITVPLATACTSGGAPTPQTGTAATDDILKGGEITMVSIDPTTLDPALVSDTVSAGLAGEIFSGLVRIDRNLNIVPDIAEEWVISNGGLTYTFTLRNDVKFHDGKPVRAQDFK